ncbi:YbhB/YbcL family Raf kinase inhibitor-like protein [Novosphingobium sp. JCM 18896]|uniref:YbhB/YbcL family Raf kinase inhibitor-like protein n=1 Tax=Novosphingobium sp. JCM 18896 TaxID=2989731 RepID=UPI0022232061|nr:YbhB/YbcL family Raf kinase inhibitor-like protein [Novosphingobium sp. JCM 18896]MCW1430269.1 YbhB/YbcL family Raf kinase inhibitor-like protein [Novosphingobium sp. JCM 18896]
MLEHLPRWLGALLKTVRAGHGKLAIVQENIAPGELTLELSSTAFTSGGRLPVRFTADGEGRSPPLAWRGVPDAAVNLALLVEDADAPLPSPLVHALILNLPPGSPGIAEGAIVADGPEGEMRGDGSNVGRNSYMVEGWLPPDPPPGHGAHDYVFQLFALSERVDVLGNPGRGEFMRAIEGRVLAAGLLVGTYSRGEPSSEGKVGALARPASA